MSILLINPPRILSDKNIWKNVTSCTPPFGLALLAAILAKDNVDCDILDCETAPYTMDAIIDIIRGKKYEYVGITSVTVTIDNGMSIAKKIKECDPTIKIIFGGVHASIFYKELINEEFIDYVVRNEGETALTQLLGNEKPENIKNLSYKTQGKVVHNEDSPSPYDVSGQPFLAYDKLPMEKYFSAVGSYKRTPSIGMITSRGCPGKCTFCYSGMFGSKIRFMQARRIADEIIYLRDRYGIKEISFYDDTFTSNRKNVADLCHIIIDEKIDITWSCFARVDTVNGDLLKLMKEAGCHQIMFGIESANEQILNNINKRTNLKKNTEAVKLANEIGINVRAMFMLGNPGETIDTIKETIDYAIRLNPYIAMFNITTPFPGTEMFRWAKENGYILTEDWSKYDLSYPIMRLPTIDEATLMKYYKIAYRKFFLRIGYVLNRLSRIRTAEDVKMNIKAAFAVLKL